MTKPLLYTDLDGVLLDLAAVVKNILEEATAFALPEPWCSSFEEAYGISDKVLGYPTDPPNEAWKKIYGTSAKPYAYAARFVEYVKTEYRVVGLSHRVGELAKRASRRDLDLAGIKLDEVIYVKSSDAKVAYLGPGVTYVEDHPRYAANAAETRARVYLITRPYNERSFDVGYTRARSLVSLEEILLREVPRG